jgi:hypothetical protein
MSIERAQGENAPIMDQRNYGAPSVFDHLPEPVIPGGTWTTDAPYRETAERIALMQSEGLLAVEMEAAALYAFAQARRKRVICFAHVTNQMGQAEGDFEKGEQDGMIRALDIVAATAQRLGTLMESAPIGSQ